MTLPPIPDARPGHLPPSFVGFAEHDGKAVALVDYALWRPTANCNHPTDLPRFAVHWGEPLPATCDCELGGPVFTNLFQTDSEAEALAVFQEQAARLAEEGE